MGRLSVVDAHEDNRPVEAHPSDAVGSTGLDIAREETWPVLMTLPQVSAVLQITETMVRDLVKEGVLRAVPLGPRTVRIAKDEVLRLVHDPGSIERRS